MTIVLNQATLAALSGASYDSLSATFGAVAIVLLLALLVLKELMRSRPRHQRPGALQVFDLATAPLMMTFGFVILMRLLALLYP
jgi:hypothetical protein